MTPQRFDSVVANLHEIGYAVGVVDAPAQPRQHGDRERAGDGKKPDRIAKSGCLSNTIHQRHSRFAES